MKRFFVDPPGGVGARSFDTFAEAEVYAYSLPAHTRIVARGSNPHAIADTKAAELAERAEKSPNLLCFIEQFPFAMEAVANVHDYARGPLGKGDYRPSLLRHLFGIGEHTDHDAAVAWNALAQLEVKLRLERERGAA